MDRIYSLSVPLFNQYQCFNYVKVTRGCCTSPEDQHGFIKLEYLFYAIAALGAIVAVLAFARLALLNLYISLPIVGIVTGLSIWRAIKLGKPAKESSDKDSDDSDKGGTNNIATKEPKQASKKTITAKNYVNKIKQNSNENQSTNGSNGDKNLTHTQPPNRADETLGCYSITFGGRIEIWQNSKNFSIYSVPSLTQCKRFRQLGWWSLW